MVDRDDDDWAVMRGDAVMDDMTIYTKYRRRSRRRYDDMTISRNVPGDI